MARRALGPAEEAALMAQDTDPVAAAVAAAYDAYVTEVRRFVARLMRDPVAAEDIVQEAYLRLAIEARADRYPLQPRAWLYRVARNLVISGARRDASARAHLLPNPDDGIDRETPESRFLASERTRIVELAMRDVGPRGRAGLRMASQGYSGREIAATLGSTELATRALLSRARSNLRRSLVLAEAV
jgi:RNA polymerase sigma-70 factor, ECF subfamily